MKKKKILTIDKLQKSVFSFNKLAFPRRQFRMCYKKINHKALKKFFIQTSDRDKGMCVLRDIKSDIVPILLPIITQFTFLGHGLRGLP